jgi:hypothetical protein
MSNAKKKRAKKTIDRLKVKLLREGRGQFQDAEFERLGSELAEVLVESGVLHAVARVELREGRVRDCFRNAAQFVRANDGFALGIGFALTDVEEGRYWIHHAWAVSEDGQTIIETTSPRRLYFGVVYGRDDRPTKAFAEAPDNPDRLGSLLSQLMENE